MVVEKVSILSVRSLFVGFFYPLKDLPKYEDTLFFKSFALPMIDNFILEKNLYIPGVLGTCLNLSH